MYSWTALRLRLAFDKDLLYIINVLHSFRNYDDFTPVISPSIVIGVAAGCNSGVGGTDVE